MPPVLDLVAYNTATTPNSPAQIKSSAGTRSSTDIFYVKLSWHLQVIVALLILSSLHDIIKNTGVEMVVGVIV